MHVPRSRSVKAIGQSPGAASAPNLDDSIAPGPPPDTLYRKSLKKQGMYAFFRML
jgi:hypothetical protein